MLIHITAHHEVIALEGPAISRSIARLFLPRLRCQLPARNNIITWPPTNWQSIYKNPRFISKFYCKKYLNSEALSIYSSVIIFLCEMYMSLKYIEHALNILYSAVDVEFAFLNPDMAWPGTRREGGLSCRAVFPGS